MTNSRVTRLAHLLVDYSTEIKRDDQVLIWAPASTTSMPLMLALYERVLENGGHPHLAPFLQGPEDVFFRFAQEHQLDYVSPFYKLAVDTFDAIIRIEGVSNTRALSNVDPTKQVRRRQAHETILKTYLQRGDADQLKWNVTLFPTDAMAQEADMSLHDYSHFVYRACHVNDDDAPVAHWQSVRSNQQRLVDWLSNRDRVQVRAANIDLTMSIKGRTFINACGKRNMPDGEIFTGPVEDSVNGHVLFDYPVTVGGREIENIKLRFKDGKVVHASATKNEPYLLQMLDSDPGARYVGEWAIGTNYGIDQHTKQILFDEKMGGSMHIAVGSGYPLTGSRNVSAIHWDMISNIKSESEITVDGDSLYKDGQFQI